MIKLMPDGPDAFKWEFSDKNGKLLGRVSVSLGGGAPDMRTPAEKAALAKQKIKALAESFAKATI